MDHEISRQRLLHILKLAYSGELAAAYAYRGHWKSVRQQQDKDRIQLIEEEEWHHRKQVGVLLTRLGEHPDAWKELKARLIGRTIGFLCHVTGWLAPMYGAGALESRNIKEYEAAARYARDCGCKEYIDCLLTMAEVEWEHEKYFRTQVLGHPLGRRLPIWPSPPAKERIRLAFMQEAPDNAKQPGNAAPLPDHMLSEPQDA